MEQHQPEVLWAEDSADHVPSVLVQGPVNFGDVLLAQESHERFRKPYVERLLLLLEHVVVDVRVKRDNQVLTDQVCLENRTEPEN